MCITPQFHLHNFPFRYHSSEAGLSRASKKSSVMELLISCRVEITLIFLKSDRWVRFDEIEIYFVPEELPDVAYTVPTTWTVSVSENYAAGVTTGGEGYASSFRTGKETIVDSLNHCWSFQTQSPTIHSHIFR